MDAITFGSVYCGCLLDNCMSSPVSSAPIIKRYQTAACIPFSSTPKITPHTREWDAALTLSDGSKVIMTGAQVPGGRIEVRFLPTEQVTVAVSPGDYVYPADVRFDPQQNLLYVKASGLAGGMQQQTWLFEYDLRLRRLITKQQVVDKGLPAECSEPPSVQQPRITAP